MALSRARPDAGALTPGRWVGAPLKRLEDPRLLRGDGRYLDDLGPADALHVAFVRSLHAHARVDAVDAAAARECPGVRAVLTGADLAGVQPLAPRLEWPGFVATPQPALAQGRVRYVGEPVAVVGAESAAAAWDAAEAVAVRYAPLPAVADVDAALAAADRPAAAGPPLHDAIPHGTLFARAGCHGDVEGAFARAAVTLRETFTHARVSASPLEARGILARWDGGDLTVWVSTQVPSIVRAALAGAFGLPDGRVRVVVPDTGGGFGQKMHVLPEDLAVAALARACPGRTAKWVETRRENLMTASQAREQRLDVEVAADARGCLLGLRARGISDAGAYHVHPLTAALEPLGTMGILPGPYRVPAYAFESRAVATSKPPLGAYRGVGMPLAVLAMERALDLVASRLGLDPVEVRRRNLIAPGEYPYRSASGFEYDSGDFPAMLEAALALAGYDRMRAEQVAARRAGRLVGVGVACYTESTGIGSSVFRRRGMAEVPGHEAATVRVEADGTVRCLVSFPSQGQGHATTVAQIVADRLGVAPEQVRVEQPDTATAPAGTGTFASRGAIAQAGAVDRAALAVRERLLALAAVALEASPADLELRDGRVGVRGAPGRVLDVRDAAGLAAAPADAPEAGLQARLEATEVFDPPGPAFSGAVHVSRVEVDGDTGRVRVLDYAVVEDCGPLLNPRVVEGQVHGALAQGIGEALGERLVYDADGQLLTGTLMDYALPTAADLPTFAVGHRHTPSPLTAGGYKGMGEGGTVGAPACVANAVADALGERGAAAVSALPILAEPLLRALRGRAGRAE